MKRIARTFVVEVKRPRVRDTKPEERLAETMKAAMRGAAAQHDLAPLPAPATLPAEENLEPARRVLPDLLAEQAAADAAMPVRAHRKPRTKRAPGVRERVRAERAAPAAAELDDVPGQASHSVNETARSGLSTYRSARAKARLEEQIAALSRAQRWKRRLHPAAW